MKMDIIKKAKGKASQYAKYVVELYEIRNGKTEQVKNALKLLKKDAAWLRRNKFKDEILLCFKTDPYTGAYDCITITRGAIKILDDNELKYVIRTEDGMRAYPDFKEMKLHQNVIFISKIVFDLQGETDNGKLDEDFIAELSLPIEEASQRGIRTVIEFNPKSDPMLSLELIRKFYQIVNQWNVGDDEFEPKTANKSMWEKFEKDTKAKDLFKTLGGKLLWTKDVLKINEKNPRLLLIAPHGVATKPQDDINTDRLTIKIAERFNAKGLACSTIVNDVVSRLYLDFNKVDEASKHKKFISAIEKAANAPDRTLVVWVHGIGENNLKKEIKKLGVKKDIQCLVGYGQPGKQTAYKKTVRDLIRFFKANSIIADAAEDGSNYCGHSSLYMNQWFRLNKCKLQDVESVQLEFKLEGIRNLKDLDEASQNIANALSKLVDLKPQDEQPAKEVIDSGPWTEEIMTHGKTVQSDNLPVSVDVADSDDVLADRAYHWLADRFSQHIANFMLEAGNYIIDTFYGRDPRAAFAKNKTNEQPPSLNRLIEKIRQSSKSPTENAPSVGWLYNAVNLAAHEAICKQKRFQTFGILGHSHKLQLLHVPKLKQIEKDKFEERIGTAFQEKEDLAKAAVKKNLSVREFKAYINEQYPDDSGSIDLTKLPSLSELRQREPKELLRSWNLAKRKVDEGQEMMGIYSKAIHKLGIVLAETDTNVELGKGRFQDWTKSKNNFNICTGCKNDCVYCYMKPINAKNPKLKQPEDWHNWELRQNDVDKKYRLRDGLVGFPTSHDIFPDILDASLSVLGKILRAGNEVLIVSKPRLECIKAICAASTFFNDKIIFRFTIGAMSDDILSYWEPNASTYDERKECLEYASDNGFRTSVSMEPMLDSLNIEAVVKELLPFVSEDIWLGTMNHLSWFKKGADKRLLAELDIIETGQTPEMLLAINKTYENNPKIKWKTDARKIIDNAKEREGNIQKSTELMGNETYTESKWMKVNFRDVFILLKKWFDSPTPHYDDFDVWRHKTYEEQRTEQLKNIPLKTWWPKYTTGDYRLELCIGALLIQQIKWPQVDTCINNLNNHLIKNGKEFDIQGLLSIPPGEFEDLIKAGRFPKAKTNKIHSFCSFIQSQGKIDDLFRDATIQNLGEKLQNIKSGFGDETRDCALLYAANLPAFIADAYARKLLQTLQVTTDEESYNVCQKIFQEGIQRDFSAEQLESIIEEYTPEELSYALCNSPNHQNIGLVLLYQQFHAGIDELGISKRWDEFRQSL